MRLVESSSTPPTRENIPFRPAFALQSSGRHCSAPPVLVLWRPIFPRRFVSGGMFFHRNRHQYDLRRSRRVPRRHGRGVQGSGAMLPGAKHFTPELTPGENPPEMSSESPPGKWWSFGKCHAMIYYTRLYYTMIQCNIVYYTTLYYTMIYYTILHYIILYCRWTSEDPLEDGAEKPLASAAENPQLIIHVHINIHVYIYIYIYIITNDEHTVLLIILNDKHLRCRFLVCNRLPLVKAGFLTEILQGHVLRNRPVKQTLLGPCCTCLICQILKSGKRDRVTCGRFS